MSNIPILYWEIVPISIESLLIFLDKLLSGKYLKIEKEGEEKNSLSQKFEHISMTFHRVHHIVLSKMESEK